MSIENILAMSVMNTALPGSLRPVGPFLEEAQAILRNKPDLHRGHVCIYCIDHGFELVDRIDLQLGRSSVVITNNYQGKHNLCTPL